MFCVLGLVLFSLFVNIIWLKIGLCLNEKCFVLFCLLLWKMFMFNIFDGSKLEVNWMWEYCRLKICESVWERVVLFIFGKFLINKWLLVSK